MLKHRCRLIVITTVILSCCRLQAEDDLPIRQSVVKVFSKSIQVNPGAPWKRDVGGESSGSGVWLGGRRVLTNEHMVRYATELTVQPFDSTERIPANLVFTSAEMDLAIIELDEDFPISGLTPPQFSKQLPGLRSAVRVYGFPEGGESLSVSEGIISRIEYQPYGYGEYGLRIQIDAAINPGNSGGPAYVDGEIVGIAFQRLSRADNIGYLIPSEEVLRILDVCQTGAEPRKPQLPMLYQRLVNPDLRRKLGLERESTGVWVRELIKTPEDYPVRVGDVLTHIGEHAIDNNGNIRLSNDLQVGFEYVLPRLISDGTVPMQFLRGSERISAQVPAWAPPRQLLPSLKGKYPDYFILGPIVFTTAYDDFPAALEATLLSADARARQTAAATFRYMMLNSSPLLSRRGDMPAFDEEELVLIANLLPHRVTTGYNTPFMHVVKEINGVEIRNLRHLVSTLRDLQDEFVQIEFAGRADTIVVERAHLVAATEDVLTTNGIPRQGSPELLKIWSGDK